MALLLAQTITIPPLDMSVALTVLSWIGTLVGVFFTMKHGLAKLTEGQLRLENGQQENLRQINAVHKRLDGVKDDIEERKREHAVLVERVENIKDTQRIRRARLEAASVGEPPMFEGE